MTMVAACVMFTPSLCQGIGRVGMIRNAAITRLAKSSKE
jgi:hypothetical protein